RSGNQSGGRPQPRRCVWEEACGDGTGRQRSGSETGQVQASSNLSIKKVLQRSLELTRTDSIGRRNTLTTEVFGGEERLDCEDRRCPREGSSAVACRPGAQAADAVAWTAFSVAGGAAPVLAADRDRGDDGGSGDRGGCVRPRWDALVPPRWRYAITESGRTIGPIPVVRRA